MSLPKKDRNDCVRWLLSLGMPPSMVSEGLGVSVKRVYQIKLAPETGYKNAPRPKVPAAHKAAYKAWWAARSRCADATNPKYRRYGGRGITMFWHDDFPGFLAEVGYPPAGHTLDRIDNNLGYQPGNVRWVTSKDNARNRESSESKWITWNDETRHVLDWASVLGINPNTLISRLKKWSIERSFSEPVK